MYRKEIEMKKYAVIDLEMCNIPENSGRSGTSLKRETIQIGAVLLDETFAVQEKFMTYVSPQFGAIDSYIHKLTGISPEDTEGAPRFESALRSFFEWLPDDVTIVTWSESDESQLRKEMKAKRVFFAPFEALLDSCVDCQEAFSKRLGTSRKYRLYEAINICDVDYDEHTHDALADAYNTALLFAKLNLEETLSFSRYYTGEEQEPMLTSSPFADLLSDFAPAC